MRGHVKRTLVRYAVLCLCFAWPLHASAKQDVPRPTVKRLADLPIEAAGGALIELSDGRLMYAGGTTWEDGVKRWLDEVFIYDIAANSWSNGPSLPDPVDASLPVRIEGQWVLLSGESTLDVRKHGTKLIEYDEQLQWQLAPDLPFRKSTAMGGMIGDELIVVGGADDHKNYGRGEATVWIARESKGNCEDWVWSREADYPGRAHSIAAGAIYNKRLYIFGGFYVDNGAPMNTDEVFCYTPGEGWQKLRSLPVACRAATAVPVEGVGIVLIGGDGDAGVSRDILVYQPDSDAYYHVGTMPVPVAAASGFAIGRNVYLAGNENQPASRQSDFFLLQFSDRQ